MQTKVPKVAKGDQVIFVAHTNHGIHRIPAKVLGVCGDGKIDLIAEDLPPQVAHAGTTQELPVRGEVHPATADPRLIITGAPFDPAGTHPDSWHVDAKTAAAPASDGDKK